MTTAGARIDVLAVEADVESLPRFNPPGQWKLFWRRFKRDKFALGSLIVFMLVVLLCFVGYPILANTLGHGANDPFPFANGDALKPVGPWTHVANGTSTAEALATKDSTLFVLGSDGRLGRDEFLRLLKGGQASLEVALGATLLALLIGVPLGALAGLLGGWSDAAVSRFTEFFMGFPILLLLAALGYSVRSRTENVTLHVFPPGVLALIILIGFFSWFYPARIVRVVVFQLRKQDFIEASRMVGASTPRIIRSHMLPHLVGPIAVYFAIIAASVIVLESAISFLNIGVPLPDPSWGNMLSTNWGHFFLVDEPGVSSGGIITSAWTTFFPAAAIALTVLCLTLIGEGVREAFDPGSRAKAQKL
jgi:peptide/nickel transport system permease protein